MELFGKPLSGASKTAPFTNITDMDLSRMYPPLKLFTYINNCGEVTRRERRILRRTAKRYELTGGIDSIGFIARSVEVAIIEMKDGTLHFVKDGKIYKSI